MLLSNPVTVVPPPFIKNDGTTVQYPSITISELEYILFDDISRKIAAVYIKKLPKLVILWQNAEYTNMGDYTQAQIESRITELLGNDPQGFLQSLFI